MGIALLPLAILLPFTFSRFKTQSFLSRLLFFGGLVFLDSIQSRSLSAELLTPIRATFPKATKAALASVCGQI